MVPNAVLVKYQIQKYYLPKNRFYLEYFRAIFLQFSSKNMKILPEGWPAGYLPSNRSISVIVMKFLTFLRS